MNGIGTLTTAPNTPPGAKALGRIFGAISPKILYLAIYRPYRPPRGLFLFFHNNKVEGDNKEDNKEEGNNKEENKEEGNKEERNREKEKGIGGDKGVVE